MKLEFIFHLPDTGLVWAKTLMCAFAGGIESSFIARAWSGDKYKRLEKSQFVETLVT